jgi:hypothetical protein
MKLPFKGTTNSWWSESSDKLIHVSKLSDEYLVNILLAIRDIARKELTNDNPYQNRNLPESSSSDFTPVELELWALENCITYPALRNQAQIRNIWNREQKLAVLPQAEAKFYYINNLVEKVACLEVDVEYWRTRAKLYEKALDDIRKAVDKYNKEEN